MDLTVGNAEYESLFKIILAGNSGVGKTSLFSRYIFNNVDAFQRSTIGVEFGRRIIEFGTNLICLNVWDTAGQETQFALVKSYFRGAHAAIVCYDITSKKSFRDVVEKWIPEIRDRSDNEDILIMLVGTKSDLKNIREVSTEEAIETAKERKLYFMETSAKADINVEESFKLLTEELYNLHGKNSLLRSSSGQNLDNSISTGSTVDLTDPAKRKANQGGGGCCAR